MFDDSYFFELDPDSSPEEIERRKSRLRSLTPPLEYMYKFVKAICECAQFSAECNVIALVCFLFLLDLSFALQELISFPVCFCRSILIVWSHSRECWFIQVIGVLCFWLRFWLLKKFGMTEGMRLLLFFKNRTSVVILSSFYLHLLVCVPGQFLWILYPSCFNSVWWMHSLQWFALCSQRHTFPCLNDSSFTSLTLMWASPRASMHAITSNCAHFVKSKRDTSHCNRCLPNRRDSCR